MKTDALPGGAVVVARHPAEARVVAAEFGERRRAGNGIRHVIVVAVGMRDGISANRACATLQPSDLALKAIIARGQDDVATVQKREEIAEQLTLCLLGQLIRDAMLAEQLARNSPAYRSPVTRLTRWDFSSAAKSSTTASGENGGRASRMASMIIRFSDLCEIASAKLPSEPPLGSVPRAYPVLVPDCPAVAPAGGVLAATRPACAAGHVRRAMRGAAVAARA